MICRFRFRSREVERDEDVGSVVGQARHNHLGPIDTGRQKDLLFRRVVAEDKPVVVLGLKDPFRIVVDHKERLLLPVELLGQHLSDAAISTDDHVILELLDVPGHTAVSQRPLDFALGHHLNQSSDSVGGRGHTEHDHGHGKQLLLRTQCVGPVVIADIRDGDHDHGDRLDLSSARVTVPTDGYR